MRKFLIGFVLVVVVVLTGVGCGFLMASMNTKPDMVNDIRPSASSQVYDIEGNEIANIHADENRMPVGIKQVPKALQQAFVAVEDNRFYEHAGIDPRGIARAVWSNINGREISEGGSTITQQLAKNAYLTQDRTFKRKVQEVFLALQLEQQYTKQEILEMYLNQIYFGQGAYGVQAAARTYFGKNVEELDLSECALLAGIPKSPNYYSPSNNMEAAKERRAVVLDQMVKYGYINSATAAKAKKEDIKLVKNNLKEDERESGAYFIDYVTQLMVDKYGADAVYKDGLKIYTTLDMRLQKLAEDAMDDLLPEYGLDDNKIMQPQGAMVAIDPKTGYVKAMVGGRGTDQFNRATMAERQPGSAFKPFVFAAALENKCTPNTIINDTPISLAGWEPQNYEQDFSGAVSLRQVAIRSLNVPTVKLANYLTIEKAIYYAQQMGISTFVLEGPHNDKNLSTALGGMTRGVTPLEMTSAYGTFANDGVHVDPVVVVKVVDRNGKVLEEAETKTTQVLSKENAAELNSMLQDVVNYGTGAGANIGRPAAGKTGTTSDYHDAWFIGYTPDLVCGVWVGADNSRELNGVTGGTVPALIWRAFMSKALSGVKAHAFAEPTYDKPDTVGSIEEDRSMLLPYTPRAKAEDKKADDKKAAQKPGTKTAGGKNAEGKQGNATAAPAAAPAPAAPAPSKGAGKDK